MNVIKYNVNSGDVCQIGRQYEYGKTQIIFEGYQVIDSANEIYFKFVGRTEDSKYLIPIVDMTLDITQQLTKHVGQFSCQLEEMDTEGTLASQSPVFYVAVKRSIKVGADYEVQDSRLETIYQKYNQMYNTISQTNETSLANESQRQAEWLTLKQEVSDAINSFDADIAISEYRTLVQTETNNFNTNAETKFSAYNQNDSQKTTAYNTNATEKLNAYNSNADNRLLEFNTHTEQIQTDISELKSDLSEYKGTISEYHKSVNLFDKTKITDGKILSSQNAEQSFSGYFYTDYIEVKSNTKYAFQNNTDYLGANGKIVCLYDENKNFKGSYLATVENGCCTFTTGTYSKKHYVRVNGRTSNKDTFMFVEGESIPAYEPYFEPYYTIKESALPKNSNPLYGKKLAVNGDSICYGAGASGGYGKIIAENNDMEVSNIAQTGGTISSGTTYSGGGNRHWICRTIGNMPTDADYYILEGGSNDVALAVPIGNLSSGYIATLDDTTFYGAMESICKQIITKFKGKKYGFLIVHQMKGGMQITNAIYTAIIECCNKWGIPYLDLAKNCVPFGLFEKDWGNDLSSLRNTYTADDGTGYGDGWHPNEECYKKYYSPKIEAWLKTL